MKQIQKYTLTLFFLIMVSASVQALSKTVDDVKANINWPAFMSRNDMVWTQMPDGWTSGAYTGNGILGTIFWQQPGGLYFEISRTDAYDHRNSTSIYTGRYRLPNGNFTLEYAGKNPEGQMRLDLWNAEARAVIKTDKGSIRFRNLTHASEEVIMLEVTVDGSEQFKLNWHADTCQTSRPGERGKPGTVPYPLPLQQNIEGVNVSIQSMPESPIYDTQGRGEGQLATAWKIKESGKGKYLVYISEVYSYPGATAAETAINNVQHAASRKITEFESSHREWWHNYYSKSFLSLPNSRLESFYWIQLYKMASATRENRPMIDLAGPWYKPGTPWPGIWWNLNVQCTYAPFPFANHVEEGNSLINWLWKYRDNLEANAQGKGRYAIGRSSPITLERDCPTEKYEVGNLGYALFNVWEQYRCTMDDQLLKEKLYPLIKGHYRFFVDFYLEKRNDGKYHLKPSGSPEYTREGYPAPADCNYNLSIFKWMMSAMLYADNRLNTNDPIIPEVKKIIANLTDYPVDPAEGFMVGETQKFAYSHRHWSHLFMIYPFYEYSYDNSQQGTMIDKSLTHWLSYSEAYRGYSWMAAASMKAMKGDGDKAVEYILASLDHQRFPAQPNTLYIEAGPVIETPLLGARTIQDITLASYNNVIRIFPALPDSWEDAAFHSMRAEGAFLVSAKREKGKTSFVRVESLAGEPCQVKTGISGEIKMHGNRAFKLTNIGNGVTEIDLKKGEWVVLYSGTLPDLSITAASVSDPTNYWGTVTKSTKIVGSLQQAESISQTKTEVPKLRRGTSQGDPNATLLYQPDKAPKFWSVATAETVMARYPDYRTAYYKDFSYVHGYMFYGFEMLYKATGDKKYLDFIKNYIDQFVDEKGHFHDGGSLTNLDALMTGNTIVMLYEFTGDERYKKAAGEFRRAFDNYPRNSDGGFWHSNKSNGQMWVDGIFMGQMFLVRYGKSIGDREYAFDEATRQITVFARHALKANSGLYYHAFTANPELVNWADPATGLSPEVWSEGLGWYALVLAETLAVIPVNHPRYGEVLDIFKRLAKGLKETQDKKTGCWYQVVDKGNRPDNWTDISGSAMFTYALQRGINLKLLEKKTYSPVVKAGYQGITQAVRINEKGLVEVLPTGDGVTVKKDYNTYVTVPKVLNAKEAVAGFLWATTIVEMPELKKKSQELKIKNHRR